MYRYNYIIAILVLFLIGAPSFAQRRLSADVEVKTLHDGKVATTTKSVYCTNNGRLVVLSNKPSEFILLTDINGESRFYFRNSNEVYTDNSGMTSAKDELLLLFLLGRMEDMGASLYGYRLSSSETDPEGYIKKTFTTADKSMPAKFEVVFGPDYLPVYTATLTEDGHVTTKSFYSQYKPVGYAPFPHRSTQIVYNTQKDSTVVRSIYSNIVVDGDDPMFDFKIPADAKPRSAPRTGR